jgi:hypothetical protein
MKDFVTVVILICIFVGTPMFFLGRFIEKTFYLMGLIKGEQSQSKLGNRLFWCGGALFSIGLLLLLFVFPKL